MRFRSVPVAAAGALLAAWVLLSAGCSGHSPFWPAFNQPPAVTLTAAPVSTADTAWYAYDIHWSGTDADGRVVRYEYAIDPPVTPNADTAWVSTTLNHELIHFRATEAYWHPVHGWRASGYHTFAIRAFDDAGARSAVVSRAFYSYTIAPTVRITSPLPSKFISSAVPPSVRIQWEGADDDGTGAKLPVKYRYRLFRQDDQEFGFQTALVYPDSLRSFYAKRNFAGWDSVGGDTTSVRYSQLDVAMQYLFVVVAVDEAGAYSPEFSLETNMLRLTPAPESSLGPVLTITSGFFTFAYPGPSYSTDPGTWIEVEVPSDREFRVCWSARVAAGLPPARFRWSIDAPPTGAWSDSATCADLGPFAGGSRHLLYIEALDDWGIVSLAIVSFSAVAATLDADLLVIDDTRLPVDVYPNGVNLPPSAYATAWPSAAELDTFLYARGGVPWRGPHGVSGALPLTRPGIFAGYSFDTLGTRLGYTNPGTAIPLSLLGRYRHVLWLLDVTGVSTPNGPESPVNPTSYLRWMNAPGRSSSLYLYAMAGGEVWLAGGTAATATTLGFNATGARNNDNKYGVGHTVFSASAGELAPGRFMYDVAHWRTEFAASLALSSARRSLAADGGWTSPGWEYARPVSSPDYSRLPAQFRRRALALGDSLPPTCLTNSARFYSVLPVPVEYLTDDNRIIEDFDPDPLVEHPASALDTLYELQGGNLATLISGRRPVAMTYYYGVETPRCVFTGFDLWSWSRQDVTALVDFVLQDLWGMSRAAPTPARPATARPSLPPAPALPGRTRR